MGNYLSIIPTKAFSSPNVNVNAVSSILIIVLCGSYNQIHFRITYIPKLNLCQILVLFCNIRDPCKNRMPISELKAEWNTGLNR